MGRVSESAGLGKRDNDCFGSGIEDFQIHEEFDFEKNLALFDKVMNISSNLPSLQKNFMATFPVFLFYYINLFQRLVFEEIEHGSTNQPDVVRLVDCNTRNRNMTPVQDYSIVGKIFV